MIRFIGAGPGDPELLTLKGKRYIDEAPREVFADILDAIDDFVYFENRKREKEEE
jgi:precorrin-4 methylase